MNLLTDIFDQFDTLSKNNTDRVLKNRGKIRILSKNLVTKFVRPHHSASDSTLTTIVFGFSFLFTNFEKKIMIHI